MGRLGKWLEPVTRWAGFNWRVNVALLSAFAAKESSVATLGSLYEPEEQGEALEQRMAKAETDFTSLKEENCYIQQITKKTRGYLHRRF